MYPGKLLIVCGLLLLGATATRAEEWTLPADPGHLAGTLLTPAGSAPWPAVLILADSGPTDRDGNSTRFPGGNNALRQLAEALAGQGVASLRVDRRGVAGSASAGRSETDLRFDDFIGDAAAWCARLQADPRFSRVTVVGHGQGAQVGMNAAWRQDADGFVSLNGPGRRLFAVLRGQLRHSLPVRSRVQAERVLVELEKGRLVAEPPAELTILFRPSVQGFLISWNRHDPRQEISRLSCPVLLVQGTADAQVAVVDAESLAAVRPSARLLTVAGMNHVLKLVADSNGYAQQSSLVDSTLMIAPEVPQAVAELVRQAEAAARPAHTARQRLLARAATASRLYSAATEDSLLGAEFALPTAEKMSRWARRFARATDVVYLFGPKPVGYVATGSVVDDYHQDCVSLLYRVSELARARNSADAVLWGLRTRFAGGDPATIVGADGRVNYDDPAHLDYSLDMIRTGLWGRNITDDLSGAQPDTVGSSRYAAGSFSYVPKADLVMSELAPGDVVWFVLDPAQAKAAKLRRDYGLVTGHIGLIVEEDGAPQLIHAAVSGLPGWYEGGTVVTVPLAEYLARVEKFAGVIVTRF